MTVVLGRIPQGDGGVAPDIISEFTRHILCKEEKTPRPWHFSGSLVNLSGRYACGPSPELHGDGGDPTINY